MTDRIIHDVEEEKIILINDFLIDLCLAIDPELTVESLRDEGSILGIQLPDEKYIYMFRQKYPLLVVDLKLLMDGV